VVKVRIIIIAVNVKGLQDQKNRFFFKDVNSLPLLLLSLSLIIFSIMNIMKKENKHSNYVLI